MIAVIVEFNTDEHNRWVYDERIAANEDLPRCIYGPFETEDDAMHWMEDIYPDDDTDVHDIYVVTEDPPFPKSDANDPKKFAELWGHNSARDCKSCQTSRQKQRL